MEFGSIRRKNRVSQPSRRKTFSSSNLSCISCNSASVGRKTVYVTLPKDFGCDVNLEGKIVHIRKSSPAHAVGILQIGDYLRIVDESESSRSNDEYLVKLQVTFGVLQVEVRPNCPLVIEVGNRSNTSLGIALADSSDNKIHITSIQPGSLADRCGFLQPGDILTSIYISSEESFPCSPYYNSYQIAQILRQLTSQQTSIKLTIVPAYTHSTNSQDDTRSGHSDSTLTVGETDSLTSNNSYCGSSFQPGANSNRNISLQKRQIEKVDELDEENGCVLSLCLWKDQLYEDWGFSLVDQTEMDTDSEVDADSVSVQTKLIDKKAGDGAAVYQIRPGGPAFVAGLRSSDRIIQINGRDVSKLESTMLVPILASLEDALNLLILRVPTSCPED